MDVSADNQIYLGLPDGELWRYEDEISDHIVRTVIRHGIRRLVTLGASGYDNHPDHITSHDAAVSAVVTLRSKYQRDIGLLALNSHHHGSVVAPATPHTRRRKLNALLSHASQFPLRHLDEHAGTEGALAMDGFAVDEDFWKSFVRYHPLVLNAETYNEV